MTRCRISSGVGGRADERGDSTGRASCNRALVIGNCPGEKDLRRGETYQARNRKRDATPDQAKGDGEGDRKHRRGGGAEGVDYEGHSCRLNAMQVGASHVGGVADHPRQDEKTKRRNRVHVG